MCLSPFKKISNQLEICENHLKQKNPLMIRIRMKYLYIILISFLIVSCQESSDSDEPPAMGTSLEDLPEGFGQLAVNGIGTLPDVTDPVTLTDESPDELISFDSNSGQLQVDVTGLVANTGISYGSETTLDDFTSLDNPSFGACEMVNRGRGFLFEAAAPDEANCILQFLIGNNTDFYDEEYHIIDIVSYEDGEDFVERFRFKINGNPENVTGLTFYMCENAAQSAYIQKTITDGVGYVLAKRSGEPENPEVNSYKALINVNGAVDSDGKFYGLKRMLNRTSNTFSSGAVSENTYRIVQSPENIYFQAYGEQTDQDSSTAFISFHELLDTNSDGASYSLSKLAVGDGAIIYNSSGTALQEGWNGDTKELDNSVGPYSRINGLESELPSAQGSEIMDFTGNEIYDCSGDAEIVISEDTLEALIEKSLKIESDEYDEGSLIPACDGYTLPQNTHLQCSEINN